MKHGDISNHTGYVIGIRVEDSLVKYKTKLPLTIKSNVIIDEELMKLLVYIYRRTEHTVVLILNKGEDKFTKFLDKFAETFPCDVEYVSGESEITMKLITGELTYYVDNDDYRRSLINSQYATNFEEFNTILRRKGRT